MNFLTVKTALLALLAANTSGRFRVVGYQKQSVSDACRARARANSPSIHSGRYFPSVNG